MKRWTSCLSLFLLLGCSAPRQPPPPAPQQVPVVPQVQAKPTVQGAPGLPVVPARTFDESLLRGREFLLEMASPSPEIRDPIVGPWGPNPAVSRTIDALFLGATQGTLDPATLVPRWTDYLQGWARRMHSLGLSGTVRTGEARETPEGLMVPVRVFGGDTEFAGWVFLVRDGDTLRVSDVQVMPTEKSGSVDPESPDQPISSPIRR